MDTPQPEQLDLFAPEQLDLFQEESPASQSGFTLSADPAAVTSDQPNHRSAMMFES